MMSRVRVSSWALTLVVAFGAGFGAACGTGVGVSSGDSGTDGASGQFDGAGASDDSTGSDGIGGQLFLDDGSASDDGTGRDGSSQFDGGGALDDGNGGLDGGDATLGQNAGGPNPCVPPSQLAIAPGNASSTVMSGTVYTQAFTVTATYANNSTADVTAQSFLTLGDASVGAMSGATFTWGGVRGGLVTVNAKTCGVAASTTFTIKLSATFGGSDGGGPLEAGSASGSGPFQDAGTSANASCNPTLVYPPDGVLLPPNTNVIEIHFRPGSPQNTQFEISFENAATDVRIDTACTPLNGGCVFELSQQEWDFVAKTNAGGDPVTVKVQGLGCDGAARRGRAIPATCPSARSRSPAPFITGHRSTRSTTWPPSRAAFSGTTLAFAGKLPIPC